MYLYGRRSRGTENAGLEGQEDRGLESIREPLQLASAARSRRKGETSDGHGPCPMAMQGAF